MLEKKMNNLEERKSNNIKNNLHIKMDKNNKDFRSY